MKLVSDPARQGAFQASLLPQPMLTMWSWQGTLGAWAVVSTPSIRSHARALQS